MDEREEELVRLYPIALRRSEDVRRIQDVCGEIGRLRAAADKGDVEAAQRLEMMYADGRNSAEEFDASFRQCREAAERGDALSRRRLGEMLVTGSPVMLDQLDVEAWMSHSKEWLSRFWDRVFMLRKGPEGPPLPEMPPALPRSIPPDPAEAARWFRMAAEQGDTQSQRYLGEMHDQGKGVAKDPETAASWYRKAAEAGDVRGQAQYGVFLLARSAGTPGEAEAVRWLEMSAYAGDVWAQHALGFLYESKRDKPEERARALPWFRMAAGQNHAESLFRLAEYYHWGEVIPRDDEESVRLFRKAQAADPAVFQNLGFPDGWRWSDEDYAAGLSWFGKYAAQGEPWAREIHDGLVAMGPSREQSDLLEAELLGSMFSGPPMEVQPHTESQIEDETPRYVEEWHRDKSPFHEPRHRTVEACRLDAEEGGVEAQLELGDRYRRGEGVPQDRSEAARWFRSAGDLGDARGYLYLGAMHLADFGGPPDPEAAGKWFEKAAAGGDGEVLCEIGMRYVCRDLPGSDAEALRWFCRAAERDNVRGQRLAGALYAGGFAVPRNRVEARRWLQAAAGQGDVHARALLGELHLTGSGSDRNYAEAARWLRKAAEQGDQLSQFRMGLLLSEGLGVAPDEAEAWCWFHRAWEEGEYGVDSLVRGLLALGGRGVPPDPAEAAWYFSEAACCGSNVATLLRGDLLRTGQGVDQDDAEAASMFRAFVEENPNRAAHLCELLPTGFGMSEQRCADLVGWLRAYAGRGEKWAGDLIRWLTPDRDP